MRNETDPGATRIELSRFLPPSQMRAVRIGLRGDDRPFFQQLVRRLTQTVNDMPKTHETDGQGQEAMVWLHYFAPSGDWYITERDQEDEQLQAYGLADLGFPEMGYIDLTELLAGGVELDFHWTPKPLKALAAAHDDPAPPHP